MAKVYKIVTVQDGKLVSFNLTADTPECHKFRVNYQINCPTQPRVAGTKLFAFRSFEEALFYKNFHIVSAKESDRSNYQIYMASAKISRIRKFPAICLSRKDNWYPSFLSAHNINCWPAGTVFCNEITLLERVQ